MSSQLSMFEKPKYQVEITQPRAAYEMAKKVKKSPVKYILDQQKFRTREDLRTLRIAIDSADNPTNYNREDLHRIYRECMRDPNLSSQWESRKMKVKEKQFRVLNQAGEEDIEKTTLLEKSWFLDWMDAVLDSKLWGFTMMEFGPLVEGRFLNYQSQTSNGTLKYFDPINVLDRDNVKPEFGIITSTPGMNTGIRFDDPAYTDQIMFVGKTHDLGLLYKCVKYILFKDNCLANWSEWAEIFGMDKRVGYTDTDGEDRNRFITAIKNLGTNAYGVFTKNDKVEFLGTNRTDAFKVYDELVNYVDEQTSKVIFGQDVVNNNTGRVVGTVGENVANMYGDTDARFVKNLVNDRLFPFMENLGFTWKGLTFDWDTSEKLGLKDKAEIDSKISAMGFDIDEKYITDTYGVPVKKKEPIDMGGPDPLQTAKDLKNLYAV